MLAFLLSLFVLWSLPFWCLLFVVSLVIALLVEHEHGTPATIVAIAFLVGLEKLAHVPLWTTILHNKLATLGIFAAYLAAGVVWSLVKWSVFCAKQRRKAINSQYENDSNKNRPLPKNHKDRIVAWMSYWPFSATYTFFDDVVGRIYEIAFEYFEKRFDQISTKIFADVEPPKGRNGY